MTSHAAVKKGDTWIPGSINARIYLVKYDVDGRKKVESSLEPDGDIHSKIYYQYDEKGRISEELIVQSGVGRLYQYTYDHTGRIISLSELDKERNERYVHSILLDENGRITGRIQQDMMKNTQTDIEIQYNNKGQIKKVVVDNNKGSKLSRKVDRNDTIPLKLNSETFSLFPVTSKDTRRELVNDAYGNWILAREFNGDQVEFIILREIDYGIPETDWNKMGLEAKVRTVRQNSYKAIYKGPKSVDKGKREGEFFYMEFNPQGYKIKEDIYSSSGLIQERVAYDYNDKFQVIKQTRKTPANKMTDYAELEYNSAGNLKNKTVYTPAGKIIRKIVYRYDNEDNCVNEIWHSPDGAVAADYRYTYDSYGRQTGKEVVKSEKNGDSYMISRTWNYQGRLTREEITQQPGGEKKAYTYTYNTNGRLISGSEELHGKPKIDYIYKFHNDPKENWKIRIKYVADKPTVYQERTYSYFR